MPNPTPSDARTVLPRTGPIVLGWIGIGVLAMIAVLAIVTGGGSVVAERTVLGCLLFALVLYLNLVRPAVALTDARTRLELVNALGSVSIPLGLIERVEVRLVTVVRTAQRRYTCAGVTRKAREVAREDRDRRRGHEVEHSVASAVEQELNDLVDQAHGRPVNGGIERTWAWPWIVAGAVLALALAGSFVLGR